MPLPTNRTELTQDSPSVVDRSASAKYFGALDGLRGIAILMVLAEHYGTILGRSGWEAWAFQVSATGRLGVDLFFVLSGFLITRILVDTRNSSGYFRIFYARRAIRIFPLYFGFLTALYLVVYPLFSYRWHTQIYQPGSAVYYLFYFANSRSYHGGADLGLVQMWSLSVEEQFYLVWPFLVYLTPKRWLLPLCGLGFFVALGCRTGTTLAGFDRDLVSKFTINRLDSLLIGAAVGIIELNETARAKLIPWIRPTFVVSMILLLAIILTGGFAIERDLVLMAGFSISAVVFASVIAWAATIGVNNPILCAWPLRSLGKYSYAIYVLHMVPMMVMGQIFGFATPGQRVLQIIANFVAVLILARLSWIILESPFLRLKRYFGYGTHSPTESARIPLSASNPILVQQGAEPC